LNVTDTCSPEKARRAVEAAKAEAAKAEAAKAEAAKAEAAKAEAAKARKPVAHDDKCCECEKSRGSSQRHFAA
jgi:hypothetical protein